jgi:hypothetical protein
VTPTEHADVLEEPLQPRQRAWLYEEVLERDGKDDQRGAACARENPFNQRVGRL